MELYKKLLKRIEDGSPIYCNETFAKDLEAIANNHFEQCAINGVVDCKHVDYTPCYGREGELMFRRCDTCGEEFD